MIKPLFTVTLWLVCVSSYAFFPLDINAQLNDLDISYKANNSSNIAALLVSNNSQRDIRCRVMFRNGPETPSTRQGTIGTHDRRLFSAKLKRMAIRVQVDLTCISADESFDRATAPRE